METDVMRMGPQNTERKAYDRILQMVVTAKEAAINDNTEPNRYFCVVCEEEVYVAAANSTERSAHFRHLRGNNNVECEYYLGRPNDKIESINYKRRSREVGELYFDFVNKNFCIGLKFSEEEIEDWEQENVSLKVKTEGRDSVLLEIKIDRSNFVPDTITFFPLSKFSASYYLAFSNEELKGKRLYFCRNNSPIFFRIMGNEYERRCKYVRGSTLYTNTKYVVAFPLKKSDLKKYFFADEFEIDETFEINTMNKKFMGLILNINYISKYVTSLFNSWNYRVENNETLTILWPPTYLKESKCYVMSEYIYLYSSFKLNSGENINVPSDRIQNIRSSISKIRLLPQTIIFKKNAELTIEKKTSLSYYKKQFHICSSKLNVFKVPEDGLSYFMFNCYGVSQLTVSQTVYLTADTIIIGYKHNYPVIHITRQEQYVRCGIELLEDILAHYKKTENFDKSEIDQKKLSTLALQYIKKCKIYGRINAVVRQYIEEGRL